jgi:hypothetical protein
LGSVLAAESDYPSILTAPYPPSGGPQIVANDDGWAQESTASEGDYYAPEQPVGSGPVRVPYAVKLSDPIVILKLPSFSVPYCYW